MRGIQGLKEAPALDQDALPDTGLITIFESREAIRRRPEMFVGPVSEPSGANLLLKQALCHAIDESCLGRCSQVKIRLYRDGFASVTDDGAGIPMDRDEAGATLAEKLMTQLHACREMKADRRVGEDFCGIGMAVVNALSEWCLLDNWRDGRRWSQVYRAGEPVGPLQLLKQTTRTGTAITFKPDPAILANPEFRAYEFCKWFQALECDLGSARYRFRDNRTGTERVLKAPSGGE
jgi:DNA gyrase subunit B